ncbi:MAG: ABC transporter permease [Sphaerochaeta sp.]
MLKKMNIFQRIFYAFCGEGKARKLRTSIFCILASMIFGGIILLLLGKNPIVAYKSLLQGSGILPKIKYPGRKSQLTDFLNLLDYTTPMVFAALAVAVALKCGLFNICVSGTMVFTGILATTLVGYSNLDPFVARILVVVIGIVGGGLLGALIGWLKYRFNMNEVIVSIMLNYIINYIASFVINSSYADPISRESVEIGQNARLTLMNFEAMGLRMNISLLFPFAILVVFLIDFLMKRTKLGFELKSVGTSPLASKYSGMNVKRTMILSMVISGALAGLAGVAYYLGTYGSIQPRVLPSLGFDAIAVALLGFITPIGCFFASILVMIFQCGTSYLSSRLGVLREIASLITSILLLFSACAVYFNQKADSYHNKFLMEDKSDE